MSWTNGVPTDGSDAYDGTAGNDDPGSALGGNDFLYGWGGDDTLQGGDGDDQINASHPFFDSAGNDCLLGDAGNDTIFGSVGNDTILGGADDDNLSGGGGANSILGGDGNDTGIGNGNSTGLGEAGNDLLAQFALGDGGAGDDTLLGGSAGETLIGGDGQDRIEGAGGANRLFGGNGNDTITAETANDTIAGDEGDDSLAGGGGRDLISGGTGADTIVGGNSNDTLFGDDDNDSLAAAEGANSIDGGNGHDTITAGAAQDFIQGGEGNDSIDGGAGSDNVQGGAGDDTFVGRGDNAAFLGSDGTDVVDYSGMDGMYVDPTAGYRLAGSPFTFDVLRSIEVVIGSGPGDLINFATFADAATLRGGDGADTITGGTGNDSIEGGPGADRLSGGDGADTIASGNTNTLVEGGVGDDLLISSGGNNTVVGGLGDDTIRVLGIPGTADTINGGDGTDTLRFDEGGSYRIIRSGDDFEIAYLGDDDGTPAPLGGPATILATAREMEGFAYNNGTFDLTTLADGATLLLDVCFAAGTRIATPRGEVAIEALAPGDTVLTAEGGAEPVLFVGRRHVVLAGRPAAAPIRIRAGALAPGVPARDLVLSPDHCLLLDGALVPARLLVNGTTIVAETARAEVTWFHLELPRHAAILAEGAAAESWLDCGNRSWFANASPAALHPAPTLAEAGTGFDATRACAPLVQGGARLAAIRDAIAARAARIARAA